LGITSALRSPTSKGTETFFEAVAPRRAVGSSDPWCDGSFEGIVEVHLESSQDVEWVSRVTSTSMNHSNGRVVCCAPRCAHARSEILFQTNDVSPEALCALRDGLGVARSVVDDRDVKFAQ